MPGLGILVLALGLVLKLRTTVVVVLAALATGIGVGPLVDQLGKSFVEQRLLSLFLLTLPIVGLCERYGLREQAASWVRRLPSRHLLWGYQCFRVVCGMLGLRVNGHPGMVRPLLAPMVEAGWEGDPDDAKAASACAENLGNFYGQNLSPVAPGLLLVFGTLAGLGVELSLKRLVLMAFLPVGLSLVLGWFRFRRG